MIPLLVFGGIGTILIVFLLNLALHPVQTIGSIVSMLSFLVGAFALLVWFVAGDSPNALQALMVAIGAGVVWLGSVMLTS